MREVDLEIRSDGLRLPARLTLPAGPICGGVVALHGAAYPSRDHFLYRHLAQVVPLVGIAVLRFDRRPGTGNVPLEDQASDALAAVALLRREADIDAAPCGLWGHSQGAWAAAVAAARSDDVAFLALVGCSGVSPAQQMRYATARQLQLAGYDDDALAELSTLRAAFEGFQRATLPPAQAQRVIDQLSERPWFRLASVPRTLSQPGSWRDIDFDPAPVFARVSCPVLLVYGERDDWVPIDESIAVWRQARAQSGGGEPSILRVPRTNHTPAFEERHEIAAVSPRYAKGVVNWMAATIERVTRGV